MIASLQHDFLKQAAAGLWRPSAVLGANESLCRINRTDAFDSVIVWAGDYTKKSASIELLAEPMLAAIAFVIGGRMATTSFHPSGNYFTRDFAESNQKLLGAAQSAAKPVYADIVEQGENSTAIRRGVHHYLVMSNAGEAGAKRFSSLSLA